MILTTTHTIEGHPIRQYLGIVTAESIMGSNILRDLFANLRDIIGGRSTSYEKVFEKARQTALEELKSRAAQIGANAVVGIKIDYEAVGEKGSLMMVTISGTAVAI